MKVKVEVARVRKGRDIANSAFEVQQEVDWKDGEPLWVRTAVGPADVLVRITREEE